MSYDIITKGHSGQLTVESEEGKAQHLHYITKNIKMP